MMNHVKQLLDTDSSVTASFVCSGYKMQTPYPSPFLNSQNSNTENVCGFFSENMSTVKLHSMAMFL
jgi:hypothetical protein